MDFDEKWAHVKKDNAEGYVLRSHLRYFRRYDPYGPYVPGVVFYPYAAMATETTEIVNSENGRKPARCAKGVVMAVSAMQDDLSVTCRMIGLPDASARRGTLNWKWCMRGMKRGWAT